MDNRTQKTLSVFTARFPIQNPNGLWTIQHITKKQNTHCFSNNTLSHKGQLKLTTQHQEPTSGLSVFAIQKDVEQQRSLTQANQKTVKTNQLSIKRQRSLNTYELLFKTSICDIHHTIEEVMYQ
ncbi:hypothetical protein [Photobacterium leiognathi]|uniref:hypothetical protein n=1 Tax=Photobacterium leiognathi TaxID=553611 RepID=UPI00298183B6|nr:hypothetical protein [Photobacterium leiognathi]